MEGCRPHTASFMREKGQSGLDFFNLIFFFLLLHFAFFLKGHSGDTDRIIVRERERDRSSAGIEPAFQSLCVLLTRPPDAPSF